MDQIISPDMFNAVVKGIPLIAIIFGLVEVAKNLGLNGRGLTILSLVLGVLLGGGYVYSQEPPVDFAGWFGLIVYGLAMGALTSKGIYDGFKTTTQRAAEKAVEDNQETIDASTQRAVEKAIEDIEEQAVMSSGLTPQ